MRLKLALGFLLASTLVAQAQFGTLGGGTALPRGTLCIYNLTPPTLVNPQVSPLQCDAKGNQRGVIMDAAGNARGANVTAGNALAIDVTSVNGFTALTGNGVTGTGSQRVTIASDNTAFSVNATLGAETTKVIGTVRALGNAGAIFDQATGSAVAANVLQIGVNVAGNARMLTASNPTGSVFAANNDVVAINGTTIVTAASGVQKVGVTGNAGAVFDAATAAAVPANALYHGINVAGNLRGRTGSNPTGTVFAAHSDIVGVNGTTIVTSASGIIKVGISGASAATLDAAGYNAVAPANEVIVGGVFQTTPGAITTTQAAPLQLDSKGSLRMVLQDAAGNIRGANVNAANQLSVSLEAINGTTALTGGVNGSQGVGGLAANGATVAGNPVLGGCQAINAELTAVTNGQAVDCVADLVGRQIYMPFANKENFVTGSVTVTTATNTSVIAAAGAGVKIYLTGFSCANTGSTASLVTFTSGSGGTAMWNSMNPAGSGTNVSIVPPVATATNTALFLTTASASTSQVCSVTGFKGT